MQFKILIGWDTSKSTGFLLILLYKFDNQNSFSAFSHSAQTPPDSNQFNSL